MLRAAVDKELDATITILGIAASPFEEEMVPLAPVKETALSKEYVRVEDKQDWSGAMYREAGLVVAQFVGTFASASVKFIPLKT